MHNKPVIFLAFANDHQGRFLEALRPEQDGINIHLAKFQKQGGIVYHAASSEPHKILTGLNQFTGQLCIFHYSGHSDGAGLQFESLSGSEIFFHGHNLSSFLVEEAKSKLKLVFLNACLTKGLVSALQEIGVPAIIATDTAIPDAQARDFSIAFYDSMISGNSLETAFNKAKAVIEPGSSSNRIYRTWNFKGESKGVSWGLHVLNDDILGWKIPVPEKENPSVSISRAEIQGDQNIVIQGASDSTIIVNVNGNTQEIQKELNELKSLVLQNKTRSFISAGKAFDIHSLTENNFHFVVDQTRKDKSLPEDLVGKLITEPGHWIQSLQQELKNRQKISVSSNPQDIIKNYGWLIETCLRKMLSGPGRAKDLYAYSFMTEAWYSSLRYLCYIQIAQILKDQNAHPDKGIDQSIREIVSPFIQLDGNRKEGELPPEARFDYLGLLTSLATHSPSPFVAQMNSFIDRLLDTESTLYATTLFLETERNRLIDGEVELSELESLMPYYLTGLTYWLRNISFLAHYRLVSIKDIHLNYRLGSGQRFDHLFGELHGIYSSDPSLGMEEHFKSIVVDEHFTYNHSVLLLDGRDVDTAIQRIQDSSSYLSLSPLLIDQSVYDTKESMTPEIFYYIGQEKKGKLYHYSKFNNDLPLPRIFENMIVEPTYKKLSISYENQQPKLNELYEQLSTVFEPF